MFTSIFRNAYNATDPSGLQTYMCKRPLGGAEFAYKKIPKVYHQYLCTKNGNDLVSGSTTLVELTFSNVVFSGPKVAN